MKKRTAISRFNDLLWKAILQDLFLDFLEFCHPMLFDKIDTAQPVEFQDKEFPKLFQASKGKNRHADVVAKVFLKTGEKVAIIVHIEAQGYPDETFSYRMEVYNYRAHDRHQLPVESIALLTDNDPDFRPSEYRKKVVLTERVLKFLTIKLLDYTPDSFQKSDKLFSVAMEAAWYGLKKNKLDDEGLLKVKLDLMRRLIKRSVPREKIIALLSFINAVVRFENSQNHSIFESRLYAYNKNFKMNSLTEIEEMPRTFQAMFEWKRREFQELEKRAKAQDRKIKAERQKAEIERQRAEIERQRAEIERQNTEIERQKVKQAEIEKINAIRILLLKNVSITDICEAMNVTEEYVKSLVPERN
jgi:hypothetical protein